ncbi:ATP-binding protein [Parasalinivibrio latis]|uniref:tight adherence pilus pseudopilin TadF n=1 Tax=Parasalinivibrio latis TaxID=2952610 RepID=UPI0030DE9DC9
MNSLTRHSGVFTVEFAIVAVALSFLLAFTFDVVAKQSVKGKLDRLSYSAVNIIKERTQLYKTSPTLVEKDAESVHKILSQSLIRTMGDFESSSFTSIFESNDNPTPFSLGANDPNCKPVKRVNELAATLAPVTSFDRQASLYQVTLCYKVQGWTSLFSDKDHILVRSYAVVVGR